MRRLVPNEVRTAETRRELNEVDLFPEEQHSLGRATERRRREFITGRACAREALGKLGIAGTAIPVGERGEPLWPPGVAGSITHCRGYRACAAARSEDVIAVGIDAHINTPLPRGLLARIAVGRERHYVSAPAGPLAWRRESLHRDKLLFCAKEAVYKAYFALAKRPLGLGDIEVCIEGVKQGRMRVSLRAPGGSIEGHELSALCGRWGVEDDLIGVAVVLPRRPLEGRQAESEAHRGALSPPVA